MTNVEALVNHARARGICTCHLTMAVKIIEFAKRYVRLEGDAVTFLEKLTNRLVPIPMEARYAWAFTDKIKGSLTTAVFSFFSKNLPNFKKSIP